MLAATSLEVVVSTILDRLAVESTIPTNLWQWLDARGDWLRTPSIEEQFDVLLHLFTSRSLKENPQLWEAFKNLRWQETPFVHDGHNRWEAGDAGAGRCVVAKAKK